jgi:hypothetical protein
MAGVRGARSIRRFLRIECERCGKVRMVNEGCGGLPARAELLTGVEGVTSRSVRRIVLRGD